MILVSPRLKFDKLPQCKLAVKVFRNVEINCTETEERCRPVLDALLSLRVLKHPNISPVWINAVTIKGTPVPAVTIPMYENGDIYSFLRRNSNVDRLALVCIPRRSPYVYQAAAFYGSDPWECVSR